MHLLTLIGWPTHAFSTTSGCMYLVKFCRPHANILAKRGLQFSCPESRDAVGCRRYLKVNPPLIVLNSTTEHCAIHEHLEHILSNRVLKAINLIGDCSTNELGTNMYWVGRLSRPFLVKSTRSGVPMGNPWQTDISGNVDISRFLVWHGVRSAFFIPTTGVPGLSRSGLQKLIGTVSTMGLETKWDVY